MNVLGFVITVTQIVIAGTVALVVLFLLSRLCKRPKVNQHTEPTD